MKNNKYLKPDELNKYAYTENSTPIQQNIVFSSALATFFRISHMLGKKANLSKFKKIEIISSIFSEHHNMKLEINYKKTWKKYKHGS